MSKYLLLNVAAYASGQYYWYAKSSFKTELAYASVLIGNFDVGARFKTEPGGAADLLTQRIGEYIKSEPQVSEASFITFENKHEADPMEDSSARLFVIIKLHRSVATQENWNSFKEWLSDRGFLRKLVFIGLVNEVSEISGKSVQSIFDKYNDDIKDGKLLVAEMTVSKIEEINTSIIDGIQASDMVSDTVTNIGISNVSKKKKKYNLAGIQKFDRVIGLGVKLRKLLGIPRLISQQ